MSMAEVREILGNPDEVFSWFDTINFIYDCDRRLWVEFRGGVVSSVDEYEYY
jgi:hypothetical protein